MSSIFKKAMGMFVEFDEESKGTQQNPSSLPQQNFKQDAGVNYKPSLNQGEIEKFEKHFDQLFNKANLPGPDYYEFWKMMETLEVHIADEKARIAAVFASLSIQGLTKDKLLESATHYKSVIEKDKSEFEKAVADKAKTELDGRRKSVGEYEKKIADNAIIIQNLTKEITDAQAKVSGLKQEIIEAEKKLIESKGNYNLACDAMLNKLNQDIQKIQTLL